VSLGPINIRHSFIKREQGQEFIPFLALTGTGFAPFTGLVRSVGLASVFENRTTDVATSAASVRQISENLALFDLAWSKSVSLIA